MVLQVTYLKIMWQEKKKPNQTKKIKKTTQKMKNIRNEKLDQKTYCKKTKQMSFSQWAFLKNTLLFSFFPCYNL